MKKYLILLITVLTSLHVSAQSDGSQLWLGKQHANSCQVISQLPDDATAKIAKQELENNWRGKNVELKIDKSLNLGEGYNIYARPAQQGDNIQYEATITASNPIGLLYGAYELIRLQNTDATTQVAVISRTSAKLSMRPRSHKWVSAFSTIGIISMAASNVATPERASSNGKKSNSAKTVRAAASARVCTTVSSPMPVPTPLWASTAAY